MIKKTYSCDSIFGSILIGTVGARVQIPNCYGDGEHNIYVYQSNEPVPDNTEFRGAIEGEDIKVFNYDGYSTRELNDLIEDGTTDVILFELKGRFGIYAVKNSGDMILQRWA